MGIDAAGRYKQNDIKVLSTDIKFQNLPEPQCFGEDIQIDLAGAEETASDSFSLSNETAVFKEFEIKKGADGSETTIRRNNAGEIEYISEVKPNGERTAEFYKNNVLESRQISNPDGSMIYETYKNNILIEKMSTDKDNNQTHEKYAPNGMLLARISSDIQGNIKRETFYENGLLESEFYMQADGGKKMIEYGLGSIEDLLKPPVSSVNEKLGINGRIDEYTDQGCLTGDCWLIAGVNALNTLETGKQIIRNSIIPNDDGSVTVRFAGAGKSFTITEDEIKKYDTDNIFDDAYSNGDNDMLVLELAMEKLRAEDDAYKGIEKEKILNGGYEDEIWKALIPNYKIISTGNNPSAETIDSILKHAAENKDKTALCFSLDGSEKPCRALLTDGSVFEWTYGSHGIAALEVTDKYIVFQNPYNSAEKLTMSLSEFQKLSPSGLSCIDLK